MSKTVGGRKYQVGDSVPKRSLCSVSTSWRYAIPAAQSNMLIWAITTPIVNSAAVAIDEFTLTPMIGSVMRESGDAVNAAAQAEIKNVVHSERRRRRRFAISVYVVTSLGR